MNHKQTYILFVLVFSLMLMTSCGARYLHSPEAPPTLGISEKGEITSSAVFGANTFSFNEYDGYSGNLNIGYSPIKHVALHGTLGLRKEEDSSGEILSLHERFSLGLYHKHIINPKFNLLFDLYISNAQYSQKVDYLDARHLNFRKQTWSTSLGMHLAKGKIGFSSILERGHIDIIELNHYAKYYYITDDPEVEDLIAMDASPFFQYTNVLKYNRPKFSYSFFFSYIMPEVSSRNISELNAGIGIQHNFR